ncbi:type I-C CRISPR-associated protein Cas8c/Csd1 [Deinococcus aquaedulcis]|uniref:type I-C CRISPR-associated protein Cas8c/Csd1 n=1 Tax=Deinococcus aquaedulcis TaxID=2840455 RepID=UPI001C82AB69|nr:type I-C CRISPR-associated protein Cas8c/Csd1 [Deinococcus aquaedulcis]
MILNELVKYADRLEREGKAQPFMYTAQVIKWLVDIAPEGTFRSLNRTSSGVLKGRDPGKTFIAPNVVRGVDIKPKLLADKAEFVFGLGDGNPERLVRQREAFLKLTQACAAETGNPAVGAVAQWLSALDPQAFHADHLSGHEDYSSADQFAFVVGGQVLIDLPEVQRYWAQVCTPEGGDTFVAQSLISGEVGPTMSIEPVKIKGIFGGQMAGMNFISANSAAFESYGLRGSNIAPVAFEEARKYATALNTLLADRNTSLSVGGVTYGFWTSEGDVPPVGPVIKDPEAVEGAVKRRRLSDVARKPTQPVQTDPAEFRDALSSIFHPPGVKVSNAAAFYSLGMTPSGSRIAVRTHLRSTVEATTQRLATYFARQSIAPMTEEHHGKLYGLYELIGAMYRDPKKDRTEADTDALIRFALAGEALPHTFLSRLAGRNRAEKRVTRPRAALTRMVLLSRPQEFAMNDAHLDYLDEDFPNPTYHLGRLLAVLDDIQHAVMKANTTLVDRFYGSMSTTPYAVMGRLIQGSQAHLQKLRKDNKFRHDEKQDLLGRVMARLKPSEVPQRPLTTKEQALFSLGYYHQKAALAAQMRERMAEAQAKKASQQTTPPNATDEGDTSHE